ncbi:MAG TPA: sigma-70 family RNA polymerase sigma factor [Candidatus Acidoferrales bacterium]|jgi:RNA polymerase sigma factor for flagellar operon FliA|nr:sigma-70 family RNA polymerase sigma factor [Candidatus Acidoferrales bacterium]
MSEMDEREARIRELLPLVKRIARRLKRLAPGFDLDDLIGDGSLGLIRAVDSFDPTRGSSLKHFARRSIAGAMLNGIRRMDPVSERARRAVRDCENDRYAIAAERGDVPTLAEMDRRHPSFARASAAAHRGSPLSLDAPLPPGEGFTVDWSADPARAVVAFGEHAALRAAVARLPRRQRQVVVLHYYGDHSLRAIGRRLSISAQRASQLHLAAMIRLRRGSDAAAS